jgi:hypothetical protein
MNQAGKAPPLEIEDERSDLVKSRCARCGALFACGMDGPEPCWCAAYPLVMPLPQADAGCYCPACLAELTAKRLLESGAAPL